MDAKAAVKAEIDAAREHLVDLSHRIHGCPELAFEEHESSRWTADALSKGGFAVEMGVCELPTAFRARIGTGPLHVGICGEYDALPDIGHACGHNVLAATAVGAGLGLARVADEMGLTVSVLGTPAEEGGGGKIYMLDRGAFDGVHAAMMVHPSSSEMDRMVCLAVSHIDVHYHGKAAHASAWPEQGINAADAITIAQTSNGLLRQHIHQTDRIHGIVTKGGEAPNVVPSHTIAKFYIRAQTMSELRELEPRVRHCFEAGALATGCTLEIVDESPMYSEMITDQEMASLYRLNAEALGRVFPDIPEAVRQRTAGSTDMANVSLSIPTIHPMLGLDCFPAVNHQPEFTAACITAAADQAVTDGAIGMAWTAIDLASNPALTQRLLSRA